MFKKCHKCKAKADVVEHDIYYCANCMIKKIGIWKVYGKIQRKNSKTKQAYEG